MTNIIIRNYKEKDLEGILNLIKELASFENYEHLVTNSVKQMKEEKNTFECLVAENEKWEIIWIAIYFFVYFSWVWKSLYVDDIVVKEEYRWQKIWTNLVNEIFKIAKEEKCKRLRWQVLDWNEKAIWFYKKIWASINSEPWVNCDFDENTINNFNK